MPSYLADGQYVVPAGVTSVRVELKGSKGFDGGAGGGKGGRVVGLLAVTPGESLTIAFKAHPDLAGQIDGCRAAAILRGATILAVAGGGGAGASTIYVGGPGGGAHGQPGGGTRGGGGGSQVAGGAGGFGDTNGIAGAGPFGIGGKGGAGDSAGGYGGSGYYGGGGGGGAYNPLNGGGGGGGSSYVGGLTAVIDEQGVNSDGASVSITAIPTAPVVTSPNGGEKFDGAHLITWTAATDGDTPQANLQYHVQYSGDNGSTWSDIVALTAPGATDYLYDFSAKAWTTGAKVRVRAWDGTSFGPWDESNAAFIVEHPVAPYAPALAAVETFDATSAQAMGWTFADVNPGDSQSAFQQRIYRVSDNALIHDTGKVASSAGNVVVPAGTLANGVNYQREVRTWDSTNLDGPYSARQAFSTSAKPTAAVTDPALDGAVVATASHLVKWSISDPEGQGQSAYKVRLLRNGASVLDTGKVMSTSARSYLVPDLANLAEYTVEVTVWDGSGVRSLPATRTFSVAYPVPPAPTITVSPH